MNPANFDRSIRPAAEMFKEHCEKYSVLPESTQIKATTGIDILPIPEMDEGHYEWFLDEFEAFTRRQELERAILKSADLLEKGDYDPVEKLIKDAVQISLQKDMGMDYFADPRARLMALKSGNGQNSTGWPTMDRKLYGGFNRGELQIFAGGSGSGKSLFMQNLAVNWAHAGLSGVYISLELSEELTSLRTDAMLTDMSTKEIRKDIDHATLKVKMMQKKSGEYRVKGLPAQSNINDIRSYIKEVQIQTGIKVDFIMVDYLDLLMPVSAKVSPNDLFVKDKYVSEELRNLAKELGVLMVTASQLNRSAVEEAEFDHSHISGGISKINTADNVFGIFTSRAMKERGKYQIQCMKSRSSTGVGQKIDLDYNIETMRISDSGGEEGDNAYSRKPNMSIMDSIKAKASITSNDVTQDLDVANAPWAKSETLDTGKISADVQSAKLKQLLGKIKTG
jgi:KaiC/GvpD/RAD55 family RecA-like ATPase